MTASEEIKTVLAECRERSEKVSAIIESITEQETRIDGLIASGKGELAKIEITVLMTLSIERLALAEESIAALRACLLKHATPPTRSTH